MQLSHHFLILSRQGAENYRFDAPHVCISVRDPGSEKASLYPNLTRLDALYLEFDDIDIPVDSAFGRDPVLFSEQNARDVLGFYRQYVEKVDGFIINCEAGISRSAAIGAALARITGYDDALFFKKFHPNRLVYRTLLNKFYNTGVGHEQK